jgi:hypothetical protein
MTDSDRKKRKAKALPIEIALLTDKDRAKFELVLEIDSNPKSKTFGKEFLTAQSVQLPSRSTDEPAVNFDLKSSQLWLTQQIQLPCTSGIKIPWRQVA